MDNNIKLVVRNIIGEEIDGYSRVTVSNELFNAVRGVRPSLPYKAQGDKGGNGVRIFELEGTELFAHYDKVNRKTMFLMKTEDAKKHLLTVAQQRANQPKLDFNASLWDTAIVASI
jgi:hypothetical protein